MIDRDLNHLDIIEDMIALLQTGLSSVSYSTFVNDRDAQDLTAYRLAIIGEAANKLSTDLRSRHPDVAWDAMYRMRNIIIHDYPGIDMLRVYETATAQLDALKEAVRVELSNHSIPGSPDVSP